MRHNNIRDMNADFQREVCRDVVNEPALIPLDNEQITGTKADGAAPDIYLLEESGAHLKERFMMSVLHTQTPPHTHLGILGASTDIMRRGR